VNLEDDVQSRVGGESIKRIFIFSCLIYRYLREPCIYLEQLSEMILH
jgi:hypothetical protein